MEFSLTQPVPPASLVTGIPPKTAREQPHPLLVTATDVQEQRGPAHIGRGHEHHGMPHSLDIYALEEALERKVTSRMKNLESAVKNSEILLRSFIETLQLWFSDFDGTPQKKLQASDVTQGNKSSAKNEDAVVPNDIQTASKQPSEGDRVEKAVQDQLGHLEQKLNLQFQKILLQVKLSQPSGQNDLSARGNEPADILNREAHSPTPPGARMRDDSESGLVNVLSTEKSSVDTERSMAPFTMGAQNSENALSASHGLGLRSQRLRLVRHIEHLTRADKTRDLAVRVHETAKAKGLESIFGNHIRSLTSRWSVGTGGAMRTHAHSTSHKNNTGLCWERWRIERLTDSSVFNALTTLLIVSNAAWIASSTDYAMKQFIANSSGKPKSFERIDLVFTILFALELLVRLIVYRLRFFTQPTWRYNIFDIIVVATGILDQSADRLAANSSYLRAVRLLRVLRMLKFVRALTFFTELQQLLVATMNSAKTLLWTLALFGFVTLLASITCMEVLLTYGDTNNADYLALISKFYGSFTKSFNTMLLSITYGELWGNITRDFSAHTSSVGYIIGAYVMINFFLIVPVLYGTHTLRVINTGKYEPSVAMVRKIQDANTFIEGLRHRIEDFGYHWDHQIDVKCMERIMEDIEINMFLVANNIEVQAEDVFMIFDTDNEGTISIRQFIFGCHFLTSTSTDSFLLSQQLAIVSEDMAALKDRVNSLNRVVKARNAITRA